MQFPLAHTADWHHPDDIELNQTQAAWLLAEGSLTRKLKRYCQHFSVSLIGQQRAEVFDSEFQLFKRHHIETPFPAVVREVLLHCDNLPWVFARSIFPLSALTQQNLNLSELGESSLGQSLFDQDDLLRSPFEVASLDNNHVIAKLNTNLHRQTHPLWGRRSLFMTAGQHVLVSEFFLSPVPIYQEC